MGASNTHVIASDSVPTMAISHEPFTECSMGRSLEKSSMANAQ